MEPHGGFDHNAQSLRIVDVLEERYPAFRGLNLSFEVREGIVKHSTRYDRPQVHEFDATLAPCLEAQIVDFADEIAYNAHDIDDGLKSGMLEAEELAGTALWAEASARVSRDARGAAPSVLRYQAVRAIIDRLATDLVDSVLGEIGARGIDDVAGVRGVKPRLVEYSPAVTAQNAELKAFLYERLYTHHRVTRMTQKADRIMTALFEVYMAEPRQLPPQVTRRDEPVARAIADYIAGMTDRFALEEYKKLFDPYERV
jgi:dGTPase